MKEEKRFEMVSALMDNALKSREEVKEAVDCLLTDPGCQRRWREYHIISAFLKNEISDPQRRDKKKNRSSLYQRFLQTRGLSLAAGIIALGLSIGVCLNHINSFYPSEEMMVTSLSHGNTKAMAGKLLADDNITIEASSDARLEDSTSDLNESSLKDRPMPMGNQSLNDIQTTDYYMQLT